MCKLWQWQSVFRYLEQIFNAIEMKLNTTSTALWEVGIQGNRYGYGCHGVTIRLLNNSLVKKYLQERKDNNYSRIYSSAGVNIHIYNPYKRVSLQVEGLSETRTLRT